MRITIAELLTEPWLIAPDKLSGYQVLLHSIMMGTYKFEGDSAAAREKNRSYAIEASTPSARSRSGRQPLNEAKPQSIAVIPIIGEIMKYDEACGPRGTETIIQEVKDADNNPNIGGIIFVVDSPGGMVTNTDRLASTIKAVQKPTQTWFCGYGASAAMWIGSSSDEVYASSPIDRVGSIGTMLSFADVRPAFEKMGVKFHEVYASLSKDKNADFREILDGKYENYIKNTLDPLNKMFHEAIRTNRPKADDSVFSGKVYFANEAIQNGLIDGIMTWEQAVERMSEVINQSNENTMANNAKANGEKYKGISAFFGFTDGFETTAEGFHINESMMEKLNAKLLEESTDKATIATLNADKTKLEGEKQALQTEVETLKAKPGAEKTEVEKKADNISSSTTTTIERQQTETEQRMERAKQVDDFDITKATLED